MHYIYNMTHYCKPIIGQWYRNSKLPDIFEVVAIDNDENLIEIQYFGGQIEELELDMWIEYPPSEIAAPEDFSGAYEIPKEDLAEYKDEVIHPEPWENPVDTIEPPENDLEEEY